MAREKKEEFNQIKYQNEYNRNNYDRVGLVMPKGKKDELKMLAAKAKQSMNEYIIQAINERIARESK